MSRFLTLLPTRGRRELLTRCIGTFRAMTDSADLLVVMDDDDASYDGLSFPGNIRTRVIPRMPLVPKINLAALAEAPHYEAIFLVGDDHTFQTPHWDTIMMAELDRMGGTGIVYPDDKRRTDIGEIPMISSDIILALGWFYEPVLKHYWADNIASDIGRYSGRLRFCPEVVIEHHHYSVDSTTPHDDTYKYGESFGVQDRRSYETWRRNKMTADVAVVRKLIPSSLTWRTREPAGDDTRERAQEADGKAAGILPGNHVFRRDGCYRRS